MLSRNERINQKKKEQLTNSFITTNKRLKRSVAVLSTSLFMTTVVKPVEMVLAAEKTALGTKDTQVYSTNPFLNQIIPSATIIAAKNDLYASVMMAQSILESGWGTSALASAPNYNLFGIKGNYNGESVNMGTLEDSGGQNYYPINAEFRKYPSYAESLQDYANLLANGTSWNPNYYAGAWKSNAASYQEATAYLTGRYATDTAYSAKLNRIIAQYGLDQYDNYQLVDDEEVDTPDAPVQAGEAFRVVQPGDTLYAIAKKYGISLVDLLTLNKLTSNMIYVGDRLVLPDSVIVEGNNPDEDTDEEKAPTTPTSEYTVVVGDTLYKIAAANGLTVGELKSLNALTSDTIFVGQTTTTPSVTPPSNPAVPTPPSTVSTITVASGDTLWKIANANGLSVAELKTLNNLSSDYIYPGQSLKVTKSVTNGNNSTGVTPPTVTKPSVPTVVNKMYTVQKGDTLYKIASANGVSVAELKAWNNLNTDIIFVNQSLKLAATTSSTQTTAPTTSEPEASGNTYTVQKGDTLYSIAKKKGVSLAALIEANDMTSNVIYVGQVITF